MRFPILYYIYLFVEIGTMLAGGFRYQNLPRPLRILEWLIIISILNEGIQRIVASFHYYNLWTSHFYTLIEIVFVVFMYSSWMKNHQKRLMLSFCLSVFVVFWIISKFTFEPLSLADSWTASISKILQIIFSVLLLMDVVRESDIVWTDDPRLWVVAGIIIYSAGSLFFYALYNMMLQASRDRLILVYSMNWILMIVSNLLFIRGFLCEK